ncbi:hypothetical protein [Gemmatimonas groenlandica]|uniref:Uncharacterized protein n=1 Tax=Gemmatimonas groenlandica TaxID=2732249 RepID=A0A6M4ILT5_9BACT|nr:hypothetical protein [Gemmatimonas groenlandica]QJR35630.1 hypothetical protein HKW67_08965 [Gemmatimonas groenlandica]
MHCRKSLGANEAIEALPIGRRIAFDARQGRLWVVCRGCERWNLTPFDERWEAIEQSERAFRDTRVRVSTDNIGLARLADGTELVRIGAPQRPEFAAWRYGDQFGRRRVKAIATGVGVTAAAGLLISGAVATGVGIAALMPAVHALNMYTLLSSNLMAQKPLDHPDGGRFMPIGNPRIIASDRAAGWAIDIGYAAHYHSPDPTVRNGGYWSMARKQEGKNELGRVQLHGADAVPLLRRLMPLINRGGARRNVIGDGVKLIEQAGGPERYGKWAAGMRREWAAKSTFGDTGDLSAIPAAARLAFEMAINEDAERQALEGELAQLERAWAEAEGIAVIADSLLVPDAITTQIGRLKEP